MKRYRMMFGLMMTIALVALHAPRANATQCERIKDIKIADTEIKLAAVIDAGAFVPPTQGSNGSQPSPYARLPSFCRVAGVRHPTPDSNIGFEIWMPVSSWNGKLVGIGNGAWAGSVTYPAMIAPLSKGYATVASDSGHQGSPLDASFAAGHPERLVDFGSRGIHEMTVAAKEIIEAFYGRKTERSLFASCSTGGRQGLMEASRYPDDYDGISSMAPANPTVPLMVGSLWTSSATAKSPESQISPAAFDLVHKAAMESCDANDGVRDGIISAPDRCHFDPGSLQCKGVTNRLPSDSARCLTEPQVAALRAIYQGPHNPRTGESIIPGFEPGSEALLSIQTSGSGPIPPVLSYFRDLVFKNPRWEFRTFDYDENVSQALSLHSRQVDVAPASVADYLKGGRKLLISHGWADPLVPPLASVHFYDALTTATGTSAGENARLFMVPGMGHCTGGDGPFLFDAISTIDEWVATGRAPDRIVVSNPPSAAARTRPICPYPKEAVYAGTGSTDDEKNFRCEAVTH